MLAPVVPSSLTGINDKPYRSTENSKAKLGLQACRFEVSDKAEAYHHITQDKISTCGQSLTDVLQEFMCDVRDVYSRGGVAVAHQLESLGVLRRCAI